MAAMEMEAKCGMDPALYKAAAQGSVRKLRKLVEKDVTVLNSKTPQDNTALHLAVLHGHAEFAREVLAISEEMVLAKNADGDTALHLAAKTGRLKVAELLVGLAQAWPEDTLLKSPLQMTNKEGNNPLHEAVRHRKTAVALALLDADYSRAFDRNEMMESPLHMAAREGLVHVVRKVSDLAWIEPNYVPSVALSGTALHQAVLGGHTKVVEIMLEKNAALVALTDSNGNNVLHYASQKNNSHVVGLLLEKKTELAYSRNNDGQTPLHVAAQYGSTDVIKALLRHCFDVAEMVDGNIRNAFHASIISGKENTIRCLLRYVRPKELLLNRVDINGDTPLHLAVKMSRVHFALLLLNDVRVDPCVRDRDGMTARSLVEKKLNTGETDTYEMHLWTQLMQQESKRCSRQHLPPTVSDRRRPLNNKDFDSVVDAYFLAATLIATVTFAATFTMPGGYDQTNGIALLGHNTTFMIFIVSNTIAMCSSIVVIFLLIWARQEPEIMRLHYLVWSQNLTIVACLAMLLSLMTAVYITVAPKAPWPAYAVIAIGACSPGLFFVISWMGKAMTNVR